MKQIKTQETKARIFRLLKRAVELIESKDLIDRSIAQALLVDVAKEVKKL